MGGWGGNRAKCSFHQRRISVQTTTAKTNANGNFAGVEALVSEIFYYRYAANANAKRHDRHDFGITIR